MSAFPSGYMQPLHAEKIMSFQKTLICLSLSLSIACQDTESKSQSNPVSPEIESEMINGLDDVPIIFIDSETESDDHEIEDEEVEDEEQYDDEELEEDSPEHFNCSLVFPEDLLEAAVYSFVAEYALSMPFAVGCYSSVYPQSSFIGTVHELEEEWFNIYSSKEEALEHAQNWVDSNFESFDRDIIDITKEFRITVDEHGVSGGLGYQ